VKNPYPRSRVWVLTGTGTGLKKIPGGYPGYSLPVVAAVAAGGGGGGVVSGVVVVELVGDDDDEHCM
jgi:hypothetical protein